MTLEQIKLGAVVTVKKEVLDGKRYTIEDAILTARGLRLILRSVEQPDNTRDEKAADCEAGK